MKHLYKYNLLYMIRRKSEMFWTLLFPVLLGTLFSMTFGSGAETIEQMKIIPVAVVQEGNAIFENYLQELDGSTIELQKLDSEQALTALKDGEVEGIFYSKAIPTLTVTGNQINESILEAFLTVYLQNQKLMEEIGKDNPLKLMAAMEEMADFQEMIQPVSTGGKTTNDSLPYFFALIGMACLFGSFMGMTAASNLRADQSVTGMTAASNLRADQSALAARRSIIPKHRFAMVVSEMLAAFTIQFLNCCLLLLWLRFALGIAMGDQWIMILPVCALGSMTGVAIGIFIGCMRIPGGVKEGILVGGSLVMSFLAGLMFGNMKDIVEHHMPIINRINPAALISDAFYCISIYDNPARYCKDLGLLAIITAVLVFVGYRRLRRERYDSL